MSKEKASGLKKFLSKAKPAKKDCCSVEIEEVKTSQEDYCGTSNKQKEA